MNMSDVNSGFGYRWYALALAALTFTFVVAIPTMCMPVLFNEIAEDLDLSLVQIGTVWGMVSLAGLFIVLVGGLLGDRFGIKRVLSIACILAGLAGALRGLAGDFTTLSATLFLFGLLTASIPTVVHKTCGVWFSGRHLGLANGIVAMGMAIGFTLGAMFSATVMSPWLGGWRNVLFLYGVISIIIGILWLVTYHDPEQVESSAEQNSTIPLRQALSRVIRIREVWILGLIVMGQMGCVQGLLGYLSLYLQEIGWSGTSADGTVAAFNAASMVGVLPLVLLSNRLPSRKSVLLAATVLTAICVGLLSVTGGALIWSLVIIAGIVRDGFMAILTTTIIEIDKVGAAYAGTALGLVMTLTRLGGFASPPIGNSLADIEPSLPFVFWAALAAVALSGFYFLRQKRSPTIDNVS
jgi:NNP family nitrate/nitrite transporter-like MFS transporter